MLETPSHPAAAGGKLFLHRQDAPANVNGPASGLRSASAFPYSSQRPQSARKPQPIDILFRSIRGAIMRSLQGRHRPSSITPAPELDFLTADIIGAQYFGKARLFSPGDRALKKLSPFF